MTSKICNLSIEKQIIELVIQGKTNIQIGLELDWSEGTIKNYLKHIYKKYRVQNRYEMIIYYFKQSARKDDRIKELENKFNCYACGNCKGKEDYRNLEKHHKGLRKQFDKQNDKLSQIAEDLNSTIKDIEAYPKKAMFLMDISYDLEQIKQIAQGE